VLQNIIDRIYLSRSVGKGNVSLNGLDYGKISEYIRDGGKPNGWKKGK